MIPMITNALVIGMGVALLVHLVRLLIFQEVIIKEPHLSILITDIVMMLIIIAFGTINVVKIWRRRFYDKR